MYIYELFIFQVIPWRNKRDVNKDKIVTKEETNKSYQNKTTEPEIKGVNETSHLIKKPVSSIVKKKQGMLMKYLYKIKDCVILKKTQIVRGVKACANQKMLENAALWVLGFGALASKKRLICYVKNVGYMYRASTVRS
ncbi:hypothetical protein J6590_016139 [Homalodisca vitripennis]|nr:hypothetical protein J6590_016139 [Homalodisca vitripennis]